MHRGQWVLRGFFLATATLAGAATTASVAGGLTFENVDVEPALTPDKGPKAATNISGISCMPPADGKRTCLVIDDEGRLAQAARLDGARLSGGGKIRILDKSRRDEIIGSEPEKIHCSEEGHQFKDLDGEAVAYDGKDFYVSGSHGCSRNGNEFKPSAFVLARVPKAVVARAQDAGSDPIEDPSIRTTYRLSEALRLAPSVKHFFARDLMETHKVKSDGTKGGGLNIEGLLVADGKLYAGLRGPVVDGQAYVIEVPVDPLFDAANPITDVREHPLALEGRGVRDLAPMPDGRILVLGGPERKQKVGFAFYVVDRTRNWTATRVGVLDDLPAGDTKAEALFVLAREGSRLDVLVMFDGPENGGPRRYTVMLTSSP